jgi:hypothetical protein
MAKDFKPNVGKRTSKSTAEKWIKNFEKHFRKDPKVDTKSVFFGRDAILKMLAEDGSTGITFFFTYQPNPNFDGKETIQLVMVPTTEDGTLLWTSDDANKATSAAASTSAQALTKDMSYDDGALCPPYCPK